MLDLGLRLGSLALLPLGFLRTVDLTGVGSDSLALAGFRLGVATNSTLAYTEKVLRAAGLKDNFEVIVTRDRVREGKPAPDVYLAAAASLNCDPGDCLVIEDSAIGLQSAMQAGMRTVLVSRQLPLDGITPWARIDTVEGLAGILF